MAASALGRLSERLSGALQASNPAFHTDGGAELAGRAGEDKVVAKLRSTCHKIPGVSSLAVYQAIRVPDPSGGHKEIDAVAVSQRGVCAIEVKVWSGEVDIDSQSGEAWLQRRRTGDQIKHGCPLNLLQHKAQLLRSYLALQGINVQGGIDFRLVMPNRNLRLSSSIWAHPLAPHLVTHHNCESFYASFQEGIMDRLQMLVLPTWVDPSAQLVLSLQQLSDIQQAMASTGTWDKLRLHGGSVRTGDFRSIDGLDHLSRSTIVQIRCIHTRSRAIGMGWAMLGFHPTVKVECIGREDCAEESIFGSSWSTLMSLVQPRVIRRTELPPDACVWFQPAGASEACSFCLNDVESVELSLSLEYSTRTGAKQRRRSRSRSTTPQRRRAKTSRSASPDIPGWTKI